VRATCAAYVAEGWGVGVVWLERGLLLEHELPQPRTGPPRATTRVDRIEEKRTRGRPVCAESDTSRAQALADRFRRHFAGERVGFDDVGLDLEGETAFGCALAKTLRAVPYGEVVTYGELAALAGRPGAQRAAGTFCARNRFAVVVPCHRVVAAAGLGGYGSLGAGYKRRLLELEGVRVGVNA
jgi:methylated-DNA-[protein]-cysteine S-methyltransferase